MTHIDITSKLTFDFIPESTYIGLNQEVMTLVFLQKSKMVSATNSSKSLYNSDSEFEIKFR